MKKISSKKIRHDKSRQIKEDRLRRIIREEIRKTMKPEKSMPDEALFNCDSESFWTGDGFYVSID